MSEKMEKVNALLDKAIVDYKSSKVLLENDDKDILCYAICFHCQQCVEKSLKAFLMYHEINFPKIHDLLPLVKLCLNVDQRFKDFDLSEFSGFGVEIRYDEPSPTIEESETAFEIAGEVLDYIRDNLK